jgi:O-antigen ligase
MLGRDLTLTGRTNIWNLLTIPILKRPLLGYGFYAFWLGLEGESAQVIRAAHWYFGYAHNGYLEIVLQLGFIGLGVFLLSLLSAAKDAFCFLRRYTSPGIDWYIGLLVLTVLYNIDEESVLWPVDLLSILYVVACCGLALAVIGCRERSSVLEICSSVETTLSY